jgi:peptide/nickel transport system substrate-binding protein
MSKRGLIASACVLAFVALACGKESGTVGGGGTTSGGGGAGKAGGSIVLGAEQFPQCLNPIQSCANASWEGWAVNQHVLPKAMVITPGGNFAAGPLLAEAPTLANGDITQNPFTVKFKINPKAVWDDGTPITSADFQFTWQAHLKTIGTLFTVGYDKITSIDTTDPHTAVVHFSQPFADWHDLFGGNTDAVLKKAAFPGGPELSKQMITSIPFSGGPWKIQSYTNNQLVLVQNPRWYGAKPYFDQITIVPREESSTELTSLLTGEISMIYPQPSVEMPRRLRSNPNVKFVVGGGTTYEGLWLNLEKPPLDDKVVREALFWATDRQAVVDTIVKPINPGADVLNCAGWVPNVGKWCDNTQFADFHYDAAKAKSLLEGDGWKLGSDGIFAKNGKRLSLEFKTTAGNKGREDTQALLKEKWKAAGIEMVIHNEASPTPIFTDTLPKGNFQVAEYAQVASPDPSVTSIYDCAQIPTAKNGYSGQNFDRWCNPQASQLANQADRTIDDAQRLDLTHRIGALVRQDLVWLPLYQKPLITAWRTDKIAGPVGEYNDTALSSFFNVEAWHRP